MLDLDARTFKGRWLGRWEYVISSDEKTSIQARCRCHPTLPPGKARSMRVEHEYERGGALAYLAAYVAHRARLVGRTEPTTGIEPFGPLVEQATTVWSPRIGPPGVLGGRHSGSHRGRASVERLEGAWPKLRLIHLPVYVLG